MQNLYNTLHHEFGHHETLSLIDGNGIKQVDSLVANNVIGTQMHNNAVAAYAKQVEAQKTNPQAKNDEEVRLINAMKATTPTALLSSIYGVAAPTPISNGLLDYPIDPKTNQEIPSSNSFAFYAAYHLIGSEFLNRAMNVLELMP